MSRTLDAAVLAALDDPVVWPVQFVSIAFDDGTLYVHTDLGDIAFGGHTYTGVGTLGTIEGIAERDDASPVGVTLNLSGVDAHLLDEAINQNYYDRDVSIYLGLRNTVTGAMLATPTELFHGKCDVMESRSSATSSSIAIRVEDEMAEWDRPLNRMFSDAELQRVYPGDLGAKYMADMVNRQITIGNKTLVNVSDSIKGAAQKMNWPDALDKVVREYMGEPLQWGIRDCCQFAATYVELRTGVDHARRWNYHNHAGAEAILEQHGGIEPLIESELGPSSAEPHEGDLVLCHIEDFETVGVTNGAFVWCIHPTKGLGRVQQSTIRCAWNL